MMKFCTGVNVIVCKIYERNTYPLFMKYNKQFSNSKHNISANV